MLQKQMLNLDQQQQNELNDKTAAIKNIEIQQDKTGKKWT